MNPSYWFILHNECLLICQHGESILPTHHDIQPLAHLLTHQHGLGQFNGADIYCAELSITTDHLNELKPIALRQALELLGPEWYSLAVKAYSIINWDNNHQYCGKCGQLTEHKSQTFERTCIACGTVFYPRISPSVIVLIHKDDEILMARSPHFSKGVYGLIAGFVEAGESAEAALHREVKEEVGVTVKNLSYFGSQAWPFPDSLMLGYIAEHDAGEIVIDGNEIECAGWYRYNQLPGRPSHHISLASKLLDYFIAKQKD